MGVRIIWPIAVLISVLYLFALTTSAAGQNTAENGPQAKAKATSPRDSLLQRKAEAVSLKAASLRRQQTGTALRSAVLLWQESARLFTAIRAYDSVADSYFQIGEIYSIFGAFNRSLASYQEALQLTEDQTQRCRTASRITQIYASIGDHKEASNFLNQALRWCKAVSDKDALGEELLAQGEVLYYSGQSVRNSSGVPQRSEDFYAGARTLFAEGKDREREAWALLHLGYARFETDPQQGIHLAEQAMQIWSALKDFQGIAQTRQALGIFAATQGQFETAQSNSAQALKVFHELGDRDNEGVVLNNMGKVSNEAGEPELSLAYYRRAKLAFAAARDRLGEAEALTGIGAALSAMGRYRSLPVLYQEKLRLAEQAKNDVLIATSLANLAGLRDRNHQFARAETLYRQSAAICDSNNKRRCESDALLSLAHFQIEQHRDMEAIPTLKSARILKEDIGDVEGLARIGHEFAYIYLRLGHLEEALTAINATIKIIESQRLQFANFDSRAAYFAAAHQYYQVYIDILMQLDQQHPGQGFAQLAFEAAEKSKVRSLLDMLASSSDGTQCHSAAIAATADSPDSTSQADDCSIPAASALTLAQVQKEIQGDDVALLEYALSPQTSYLWLVENGQIAAYHLPGEERISDLARRYRVALTARQPLPGEIVAHYAMRVAHADQELDHLSADLSEILLRPVAGSLAGKRLIIVPDGLLRYIPFAALQLPVKTGDRLNQILGQRFEVVTLPSASTLESLRAASAKRAAPTRLAAVFADPVFAADDPRVQKRGRNNATPVQIPTLSAALRDVPVNASRIPRLGGSGAEADAIAQALSGQVDIATGFGANREAVLSGDLSQYRYIHFATHGLLDSRRPELSGLILSLVDANGKPEDGYLRVRDIYGLKLNADLVVLSSCSSALGKDVESEGIIGLTRAFLFAGSKRIISSLWKVNDEATKELMKNFYSKLHTGVSPAAALQSAQSTLANDPYYKSPYYWAAFILQGEYK